MVGTIFLFGPWALPLPATAGVFYFQACSHAQTLKLHLHAFVDFISGANLALATKTEISVPQLRYGVLGSNAKQ